ncbi:MAG: hypothetical protein JXA15_07320 [Spirochaetales bacterium]|nr:hypothetical protein [Spirochaetales bacterium]
MKRPILAFAIVMLALSVHAQALGFLEPGEFAWYLDERGEGAYLRCYLYLDSSLGQHAFLVRSIDLKVRGSADFYLMYLFETEEGLRIGEVEGDDEGDAPGHRQAILDAANFANFRLFHAADIGWSSVVEDPWTDRDPPYTLHFDLGAALPLFGFSGIRYEDEETPSYRLISAGIVPPGADPVDYIAKSPPVPSGSPAPSGTLAIEGGEALDVRLGYWSLTLDGKWTPREEPGYRGYWLSERSGRDAQVSFESAPLDPRVDARAFVARVLKMTLLTYNLPVNYDSVEFEERDGLVWLRFAASREGARRTAQVYAVKVGDGFVELLNFSAFEDVWLSNEAYFEGILDSVR